MMIGTLALEVPPLNPAQRAVWTHFQKGGSVLVAALVLLGIALILGFSWWLNRRDETRVPREEAPDPWKVFGNVQRAMRLPTAQRALLSSVARNLHLSNPSVLLLSPALFDQYVCQWQCQGPPGSRSSERRMSNTEIIAQVRTALFE